MSDQARDMATYLDAQGVGTLGTDIFYSKLPASGATYPAATVLSSGGFDPSINSDRDHFQPTIQITITGADAGYDAAYAFAESVRDVMIAPLTLVSAPYTYYGAYQQGDIESLGYDENNRPEFSTNFRLYRRKAK